jgi:hypothetical protein
MRRLSGCSYQTKGTKRYPAPNELGDDTIYVVNDTGLEKWACFKCPGGCGEKMMLSLLRDRRPRWTVKLDWLLRPSVKPSVWQTNECGCHFCIEHGHVAWCADGKPTTADRPMT